MSDGIPTYSTTAATNSTMSGVSCAEGCPFANVNNLIRQHMADERTQWNDGQWWNYGSGLGSGTSALPTYTYVAATQFKITGIDVTAVYHVGRRVKIVAATPGTIYGTISASSFGADTTVTVTFDSGSLSNEALTVYIAIVSFTNQSLPQTALTKIDLTGGTATTVVDPAADFLLLYDASATANRKVLVRYVSPLELVVACSDETTALSTGTGKVTFRMPSAMTVTAVRASLTTAQTSGTIFTVDINEAGVTIISTKLTIDNTEKTSTTAVTAPVISDTSLADDAEITVDIDQIGDGTAKGLKVALIGYRT